jgi:hypothetical protein
MKFLKHFLFMLLLVAGLSVAAMAQKGDPPKRPPKDPPVVVPGKGNPPPREAPKDGDKPKHPHGGEAVIKREDHLVDLA